MAELRDYQRESLVRLRNFVRNGGKRGLVALPTGTGKTFVFAHLPKLFEGGKTLVLAHREELLDQAAATIRTVNPGLKVGIEQAERRASKRSDVVVASIQTLTVSKGRLARWSRDSFQSIVIDEAHHATAASYLKILAHFGLAPDPEQLKLDMKGLETKQRAAATRKRFGEFRPDESAPNLFGFTATPGRTDKRGLEWIFDDIVFSRTILEMMEAEWLCKIRGLQLDTDSDISGVKVRAGEFAVGELAKEVNTPARNKLAVAGYKKYAKGRQALAFAVDVAHAQDLCTAFVAAGVKADYVIGATASELRRETVDSYKNGEIDVLVNCMVLTEGFDAPNTSCLVMARPTKSQLLYTQMLGRGTRLAAGKEDLLVIDLVDISQTGVPTLNTLFGLPPKLSLASESIDVLSARKAMDEFESKIPLEALANATSLDEVATLASQFDPMRLALPEDWLKTTLAWCKTSYGYALSLGQGAQLGVVVGHLDHAELRHKMSGGGIESLGWYSSAQVAIEAGETWVRASAPERLGLLDRDARWRKAPATDSQKALAKKLGLALPPGASQGDVSTLLDSHISSQQTELATPKQAHWMRQHSLTVPEGFTKRQASAVISATIKNEGRVPEEFSNLRSRVSSATPHGHQPQVESSQMTLGISDPKPSSSNEPSWSQVHSILYEQVRNGVLELYRRQTEDEKSDGFTRHQNGVGFNGADSAFGTSLGIQLSNGIPMTERQFEAARRMLQKYKRQLGLAG